MFNIQLTEKQYNLAYKAIYARIGSLKEEYQQATEPSQRLSIAADCVTASLILAKLEESRCQQTS